MRRMKSLCPRRALMAASLSLAVAAPALADKIKHPRAIFSGLDKITSRIISFEVAIDETVQFGSLQITARVCYTRPATEAPQTTSFIEVDEIDTNSQYKRIFSGWVFAASPGLSGVEHPVYDIWLIDCKGGTEIIASAPEVQVEPEPEPIPGLGGKPAAPKPKKAANPDPAFPPPAQFGQPNTPTATVGQQQQPARPKPSQSFFPTNANANSVTVGPRPEGSSNR